MSSLSAILNLKKMPEWPFDAFVVTTGKMLHIPQNEPVLHATVVITKWKKKIINNKQTRNEDVSNAREKAEILSKQYEGVFTAQQCPT